MPCDAQSQASPQARAPEFNQLALCPREQRGLGWTECYFPQKSHRERKDFLKAKTSPDTSVVRQILHFDFGNQ